LILSAKKISLLNGLTSNFDPRDKNFKMRSTTQYFMPNIKAIACEVTGEELN
jgi:hypothetical protein